MSLDVYLTIEGTESKKSTGIFIRDNGQTREITREEWDAKFPGISPVVIERESQEVFKYNITHNLNKMASEAGLYNVMWRPEESGWFVAEQLIPALEKGLETLKSDPEKFREFNPKNGWGDYRGLVTFAEKYLDACKQYPMATVSVSR